MTSFDNSSVNSLYNGLKNHCKNTSRNFAILKIAFPNEEIASMYTQAIQKHNDSIINNYHCDAGFDLFVPYNVVFNSEIDDLYSSKMIEMKVTTEMIYCDVYNNDISPAAFHLCARSSISKTPLMLANHIGIVDSGYRGYIIGAFRWLKNPESNNNLYVVEKGTRLVQICHPTLCPIYIMVVDESELTETSRGSGGFGSTGQ